MMVCAKCFVKIHESAKKTYFHETLLRYGLAASLAIAYLTALLNKYRNLLKRIFSWKWKYIFAHRWYFALINSKCNSSFLTNN